jgi:hypothetical protein
LIHLGQPTDRQYKALIKATWAGTVFTVSAAPVLAPVEVAGENALRYPKKCAVEKRHGQLAA